MSLDTRERVAAKGAGHPAPSGPWRLPGRMGYRCKKKQVHAGERGGARQPSPPPSDCVGWFRFCGYAAEVPSTA